MKKLLLACLAGVLATPASAATSHCVTLTDPPGDSRLPVPAAPPSEPAALDLLGAHLVAGTRGVTATITVAVAPEPLPGFGLEYGAAFEDDEAVYELHASVDSPERPRLRGTPYELHITWKDEQTNTGGSAGVTSSERIPVTGSVDLARRTIRITAPASAFTGTALRAGRTWRMVDVQSAFGDVGNTGPFDRIAGNGAPLVVGDGTCSRARRR